MVAFNQNTPNLPRPGWLLLANSILLTGACLFAGGVSLSSFFEWRYCTSGLLIGFGLPVLALGWLQYTAIFRGSASSAAWLSFLLLAGTAGWLVGATKQWDSTCFAAWLALTGASAIYWCRRLFAAKEKPDSGADQAPPSPEGTVSRLPSATPLGHLGWFRPLAAWLIVLVGVAFGRASIPPREAHHVSPTAAHLDLPAGAGDVCVLYSDGVWGPRLYDFAIDELGFRQWTQSLPEPPEMQPINEQEPVTVLRIANDDRKSEQHVIRHGWYHRSHSRHTAADYVDYAYDADNGRAYFSADRSAF